MNHFSGGEKARLALALLIYQKPNCLMLDEPTNHLDIQMREAFILALQQFSGSVLLVSHDRHFVSSVVDEIWCVADKQVKRITGDLSDYKKGLLGLTSAKESPSPETLPKASSSTQPITAPPKKMDHKKIKKIEARTEKITEKIKSLEQQLADPALYNADQKDSLHELVIEHKQCQDKLQQLENLWLEAQS